MGPNQEKNIPSAMTGVTPAMFLGDQITGQHLVCRTTAVVKVSSPESDAPRFSVSIKVFMIWATDEFGIVRA